MIQDKLVTIKKKNIFDKGWALFTPFQSGKIVNRNYQYIRANDIVKQSGLNLLANVKRWMIAGRIYRTTLIF